ncbi:SHOCT domain-containing protein [Haladaptatus sp.]|uniref:SHOCT domain-containing protein n=1 Tax=Haladaptatus sp. TaxID=1973141 RepID=UPI003C3695CC
MATSNDHDSLLRLLVGLIVVLLLLPLVMMAFAFPMMGGWMMGGRYGAGYMPLWGWLVMLVPLVLLFALGYFVYRSLHRGDFGSDPALTELRTAYARGDISEEEFEQRRRRLREEK